MEESNMKDTRKPDEALPELRYDPQQDEEHYKEAFNESSKPLLLSVIQSFGGYIGKGKHSTIFKGQMVGTKRAVTIKVDNRPLEKDENYNAIRNQINNLRTLHHPGIAGLIDFIPDWDYVNPKGERGRSFIIMQHIDGKGLNQVLIDEGCPRQKRVLNWTIQILGVLRYLHQNKRIAGHITPSNLVLRPDDRICMVDFNYISEVSDEIRETKPQSKDRYRFGKVLTAEELQAGILSDIAYLGSTMFELLTGKEWNPDNVEVNNALFDDAKVSPSVRDVICKALAENPDDRYQSALEMELALRRLPKQDIRFQRHMWYGVAFSLLCTFLLALGGFYDITGRVQINRNAQMDILTEQSSIALQGGDYTNALRLALEATDRVSLDPPVSASAQSVLVDALGVYNGVSGYQPFRSDFKLRGRPLKALFSPDGRTFAVLVAEATAYVPARCLQIFDAESGKEIVPSISVRNSDDCAFLFTGYDTLLYEGTNGLTSYDLTTGKTAVWMKDTSSSEAQTGLALSADGKVVAYVVWETRTAYIFNAQTQTLPLILTLAEISDNSNPLQQTFLHPMERMVALDATGQRLAVSLPSGGTGLFFTDGSEPRILSQTSQYQYFEGGFCSGYFAYVASSGLGAEYEYERTEFALIDLDMKSALRRLGYSSTHIQADENGIYLSTGNDLYRLNLHELSLDFLISVDNPIQSLRHAAGRLLVTTAAGQTLVYQDDGAWRTEISRDANFSIAELSKNYLLLGRPDKTTLSLLKWQESGDEILAYSPDYTHVGAYVHTDKQSAVLFNARSFRIYDMLTGDYQEKDFEPFPIQSIIYLRRRTADNTPQEECLKVVYQDAVRFYSAKSGEILSEFSRESYVSDGAPDVFLTEHYRLEQAVGDAICIYDASNDNLLLKRIEEGILMDTTELNGYLLLFLRGLGDYDRYTLVLDSNLNVTTRIPQACDALPDGTLIFDDNQGRLSKGRLYSLKELRAFAMERLNGE